MKFINPNENTAEDGYEAEIMNLRINLRRDIELLKVNAETEHQNRWYKILSKYQEEDERQQTLSANSSTTKNHGLTTKMEESFSARCSLAVEENIALRQLVAEFEPLQSLPHSPEARRNGWHLLLTHASSTSPSAIGQQIDSRTHAPTKLPTPDAITDAQIFSSSSCPCTLTTDLYISRYGLTPSQTLTYEYFSKLIEVANFHFAITAIASIPAEIFQERTGGTVDCSRFRGLFDQYLGCVRVEQGLRIRESNDGGVETGEAGDEDERAERLYMELKNIGLRATERWEKFVEMERTFL
jgi:hypothetical protein